MFEKDMKLPVQMKNQKLNFLDDHHFVELLSRCYSRFHKLSPPTSLIIYFQVTRCTFHVHSDKQSGW